jgi:hypothetical protein
VLRSAKNNENGTVVEITKEAKKRKYKVKDINRYQIKRRMVDFRMLPVRIP